MRGRQNIMEADISVPLIAQAWVTGYDSQNHRLKVLLADGQVVPYSVQVIINGPADPFAVNQVELPRRGTKGIVLFPNRDIRSGVWLGAYNPNLNNAICSPPQTPFENLFSHWNGAYEYMDQTGNYTKWFTDGTYLQVAQSTTLPTLHRNVYNGSNAGTGAGTRQTYPTSARIVHQPSPFNVYLSHPTGTTLLVDTSGNVNVTSSGSITASAANGKTITVQANGTSFQIDATGNILMNLAGGKTVQVNGAGDSLALVSALTAWLSGHTHTSSSPGNPTSTPIQPITAATIQSSLVKVAS